MPLPAPSEIIKCENIASCFQETYNFFFAILIALAFLNFLYGAFLYLLSGGGIYSKDAGKKRMTNSIIAVIVALTIPIILNMINPEIFKVVLKIPEVKILRLPEMEYEGEDHAAPSPPEVKEGFILASEIIRKHNLKCLGSYPGVQVNKSIENNLVRLDRALCNRGIRGTITSGYSLNHQSPCHTKSGTCIDIIVVGQLYDPDVPPQLQECQKWLRLGAALREAGFTKLIYEDKATAGVEKCVTLGADACGIAWKQCKKTTGKHIHAEI